MDHKQQYKYRVGGPLQEDDPCYVERQADKDLYEALLSGEYCYVLNSRQMGKSSLVVRARKKLEAEGYAVAYIDLTLLGTEHVSLDQWYTTLLSNLVDSFQLEVDPIAWWHKNERIVPLARLSKFIETFLLAKEPLQHYVIVVDEIDTVLSLQEFRADDFFAFIRGCCIQRTHKSEYNRLTFILIGVATPADLIADRDRTPFNLGRAIALHGFQSSEAYPLAKGLEGSLVEKPQAVLPAILEWTGGQPFLTQKLCQLILDMQLSIPVGQEAATVQNLVESRIIKNWEETDKPQHLGTIRDRIIRNMMLNNIMNVKDERHASNLLSLYQKILQYGKISTDNSPEQEDLRLSGLVIKQDGTLKVYNRIYQAVFNEQWVQRELAKLRPYREQLKAWANSNYVDESRLLHGKALQDALMWAEAKPLSEEDRNFLDISRAFEQISQAPPEVASLLRKYLPELQKITSCRTPLIQAIQVWAGSQSFLVEHLCQLLIKAKSHATIPPNQAAAQLEQLVQSHIIQDWENQPASEHLKQVQLSLLDAENRCELLHLYRQILQQEIIITHHNPSWDTLTSLGLVDNQQGRPQVSNQIYAHVFNLTWIEQELTKKRQIIGERYEVIREIDKKDFIHFLVKDQHRSKQYVIKQIAPAANDSNTIEETKRLISRKLRDFGKIDSSLIPELDPYFEEDRLYIIQEYIEGHNLDEKNEIQPDKRWSEAEVVALLINILESLAPIHQQGLAHLNLKPENLRRRQQDGKIVPIDFAFLKEIMAQIDPPDQSFQLQQLGTMGYTPPQEIKDWLEPSYDIYAIGMVGIYALTGMHPGNLPIDKTTQAVIWRFTTPDKPMVNVSSNLERILHKMVSLNAKERYANAAEVLKDLNLGKKPSHPWLADQRVLKTVMAGLLLTNILSIGWYQRSLNHQQANQQATLLNTQQMELVEQCHQPIQSTPHSKQNLINLDLVVNTRKVLDACTNLKAVAPNQPVLQPQGKALLLLWQSALQFNQKQEARSFLDEAKKNFQKAVELDKNDPQSNFYLGLVKQLSGENNEQDYTTAANLYLARSAQQSPSNDEDYIVLAKLAIALDQAGNFKRADQLYEKSIEEQPKSFSSTFSANLLYNRGVLNARYKNAQNADDFFKSALILDPKNQFTKEYRDKCRDQANGFSPLCTSPESTIPTILPIYWCKNYPALAIAEKNPRKPLCQY